MTRRACVCHCHVFCNLQLCSGIIYVCCGVLFWLFCWLIVVLGRCVTLKNSGIIVSFITEESVSVASNYWGWFHRVLAIKARLLLSILFASILVSPNHHFFQLCCCFHCSFWSMTQFALHSCPARIKLCPDPVPSRSVLCCAFIEDPATVCALSRGTCNPAWSTSYTQE